LKILNGHEYWVNALGVINKQKVVSGSNDKTLRVWDIDNGECLQEFKGHEDWVSTVAVINEQKVVSGSRDKTLRVWDIHSGVCLQKLKGHKGPVNAVAVINEHTVVSGSSDRTLRIWNLNMPSLTAKQMIVLCTIATKVVNDQPMQENDALRLKKEVQELFSDEKADEKRYKDKMLEYLNKYIFVTNQRSKI
jgi:WD40 repeat protein